MINNKITVDFHPVHAVTAETAPVAADLWTKPMGPEPEACL